MLCYAILYCTICYAMLCYSILYYTIYYTILYDTMLHYTMLHHTTLYYDFNYASNDDCCYAPIFLTIATMTVATISFRHWTSLSHS